MPNIAVKDEAHWLALRELNIGGSDVAALFGRWLLPTGDTVALHAYEEVPVGAIPMASCSPYTNAYALWLAKTGKVMPEDWNPSERMQAGTYLEPALAEWAKAKWDGWRLRKVRRYHTHPTVPGWGASVDYEVHGPGMEPVEFKNIDGLVAKRDWVMEGDEILAPPLHIILQVQHYLGARGAQRGWIVACVGGNKLMRGTLERHEPTIERIGEAITAFWRGVAASTPPNWTSFENVKDELAYGTAVADAEARDLSSDGEAAALARRYLRLKKHADFIEGWMDSVKGKLALKVGDVSKARGSGFRVSWPIIERAEKTIPARVQAAKTYRGAFTVTPTE